MRKQVGIIVLLILLSSSLYAVDFSIGSSFGAGFPNIRGRDYEKTIDEMDIVEAGGFDFDDADISKICYWLTL